MELCGALSQTMEHCNLLADHVERGIRIHSATVADGSYSHRWCYDEIFVPAPLVTSQKSFGI